MHSKSLRILIISLFSVALTLSVVLGVHVYLVTTPDSGEVHAANWQLHKINFSEPISNSDEVAVRSQLASINEVERIYFSPTKTSVVFALHHPSEVNVASKDFMNQFPEKIQKLAKVYVPTAQELAQGCPIKPNDSFPNQVKTLLSSVFK